MESRFTNSYYQKQEYEKEIYDEYILDDTSALMSPYHNNDGMSISSEEYGSIFEGSSLGSYVDGFDDLSSTDFYFHKSYSSENEYHSDTSSTIQSTNEESSSLPEPSSQHRKAEPLLNGILKRNKYPSDNKDKYLINGSESQKITDTVIDKIRESELEDVLQYAKDIINPDPSSKTTSSPQPAKVVRDSFKHLLSVKEVKSKTGAFKYRTVEIPRSGDEDLGFSVRQGDGWEKKDGIFISRVSLGSIYDKYEILAVGDELMQVNKVDVRKMTADDVIRLMYMPQRLSITIKMLTPFSHERLEKSGVTSFNVFHKKQFVSPPKAVGHYRIAQMKIGNSEKRNIVQPKRTILVRNKTSDNNAVSKEQKKVKISPYRKMENGREVPITLKKLSPIREVNSESQLDTGLGGERQSYVTWSDQRSVISGPP